MLMVWRSLAVAASSFANARAGHESTVSDLTFAMVVGGNAGARVKSTAQYTQMVSAPDVGSMKVKAAI
jgi:hypothetical protein